MALDGNHWINGINGINEPLLYVEGNAPIIRPQNFRWWKHGRT